MRYSRYITFYRARYFFACCDRRRCRPEWILLMKSRSDRGDRSGCRELTCCRNNLSAECVASGRKAFSHTGQPALFQFSMLRTGSKLLNASKCLRRDPRFWRVCSSGFGSIGKVPKINRATYYCGGEGSNVPAFAVGARGILGVRYFGLCPMDFHGCNAVNK